MTQKRGVSSYLNGCKHFLNSLEYGILLYVEFLDDAFINTTHEENDMTDELSVQPNNYVLGTLPGESPGSTVSSQCYLDIGMDNMQLGVKVEKKN